MSRRVLIPPDSLKQEHSLLICWIGTTCNFLKMGLPLPSTSFYSSLSPWSLAISSLMTWQKESQRSGAQSLWANKTDSTDQSFLWAIRSVRKEIHCGLLSGLPSWHSWWLQSNLPWMWLSATEGDKDKTLARLGHWPYTEVVNNETKKLEAIETVYVIVSMRLRATHTTQRTSGNLMQFRQPCRSLPMSLDVLDMIQVGTILHTKKISFFIMIVIINTITCTVSKPWEIPAGHSGGSVWPPPIGIASTAYFHFFLINLPFQKDFALKANISGPNGGPSCPSPIGIESFTFTFSFSPSIEKL